MRAPSLAAIALALAGPAQAITPIKWSGDARMNAIDRVIASEEIRNLKARYWLGVDYRDAAIIKATLAPDVTADYTEVALPADNAVSEVPTRSRRQSPRHRPSRAVGCTSVASR
jgi:hypothetical protein